MKDAYVRLGGQPVHRCFGSKIKDFVLNGARRPALLEREFVSQGKYTYDARGALYEREQSLNYVLRASEALTRNALQNVSSLEGMLQAAGIAAHHPTELQAEIYRIKQLDLGSTAGAAT